jgi:putative two-component system response regulator
VQDDLAKAARILIVDDREANVRLLEGILRRFAGDASLKSTTDSREVSSLYTEFQPDLILLDLRMPHLDGFMVMEELKRLIPVGSYLPILVLTADITPEAKQQALAGGAKDFLTKPFDPTEVVLRIKNLLETRFLHLQLQDQNQILEEKVDARTRELKDANRKLEEAHIELMERMSLVVEYRDDDTGEHTKRVGQVSALLARGLGLPQDLVMLIRRAAPLHDVGKIAIPDRILLKPGRLTPEEFDVMKTHTTIGANMLSGGRFPLLKLAEEIALAHHERWDGSGYPQGLAGEAIPLAGRIVAIADSFDTITQDRPYKKAVPVEGAFDELQRCSGTHFDPRFVKAFLALHADPLASAVLRLPVRTHK